VLASALATALLITGASFTGPLAVLLLLAAPLPIAYVGLQRGWQGSAAGVALAALLISLDNWPSALQYLLVFGPGTLLVPELLRRKVHWDHAVAAGTFGTLALMIPIGVAVASTQGESLTGLVRQLITEEVSAAEKLYPSMQLPPEQLIELQKVGEMLVTWVPRLYPAFLTVAVGGAMLVLALVLRRLFQGRIYLPGALFHQWKLPEQMVWGVIVAGFSLVIPWPPLKIAALNVLIALLPLYFLQGLAIVAAFLVKRNLPPFIRGMVYVLIVILNPLPLLVTAMGVFDLWVDFRKPRIKKS